MELEKEHVLLNNKVVEAQACGKIYIAGEYAVVLGSPAIIAPVWKYVNIKLEHSDKYYLKSYKYHQDFQEINLDSNRNDSIYIVETIKWFRRYLIELDKKEEFLKIEITSNLDLNENLKFGFGSSAAIIIGLLKGLFNYYNLEYSKQQLYKAGVMVQRAVNPNTSYGDLACIAYESVIYYRKFDSVVNDLLDSNSIIKCINSNWKSLEIEELEFRNQFLIVHTMKTASSYNFVKSIYNYKNDSRLINFISNSEKYVNKLKEGNNNLIEVIRKLDYNLKDLEKIIKTTLVIPEMNKINKLVRELNGSMKFSGAGGGDCVICFFENETSLINAKTKLNEKGYYSFIYPC